MFLVYILGGMTVLNAVLRPIAAQIELKKEEEFFLGLDDEKLAELKQSWKRYQVLKNRGIV